MIVSLNEIESLALKAARGAGFAWGLAEEVAWAARWLASHDLDVMAALEGLLSQPEQPRGRERCPMRLGCHICDICPAPLPGTLPYASWPIWLVPFVAAAAAQSSQPAGISWGSTRIVLTPDLPAGVRLLTKGSLLDRFVHPIHIGYVAASEPVMGRLPQAGERHVRGAAWERLGRLEARTYVPASRHSREAGAGAGTSDND